MKILLIIFSVFCFSLTNAQTIVETKSDSTISNTEWQKKVDGKLDLIIENLTKKNNTGWFPKTTEPQKSKQADSLRIIIDSLEKKIHTIEVKVKIANDSIYIKNSRISSLSSRLEDNDNKCSDAKKLLESDKKTLNIRITGLNQNEIANLIKEIDALKNQPFTFSVVILECINNRISLIDDQKSIINADLFNNFRRAALILNEANNSLSSIYDSNVDLLLKSLDDGSFQPQFTELYKMKNKLKILLENYCSTTNEVKKYLTGSEQIPDEQTRIIYIKDNAIPEAEGYIFLEELCKKVIKDKNQNILRDFSCQ